MKYCSQCGTKLNSDAAFCSSCGCPQNPPHQHAQQENPLNNPTSTEVFNGNNPIEQNVIKILNKYCNQKSLLWGVVFISVALVLQVFYYGYWLNFSGILMDITEKVHELIPYWLMVFLRETSMLYLFMCFVNVLYKAGGKWPLLYITPCLWGLTILLTTLINLTDTGYEEANTINNLYLASYICVGIVGFLSTKISFFAWTGKVVMTFAFFWTIFKFSSSSSIVLFILTVLSTIWFIYEINSRLRQFYETEDRDLQYKTDL